MVAQNLMCLDTEDSKVQSNLVVGDLSLGNESRYIEQAESQKYYYLYLILNISKTLNKFEVLSNILNYDKKITRITKK